MAGLVVPGSPWIPTDAVYARLIAATGGTSSYPHYIPFGPGSGQQGQWVLTHIDLSFSGDSPSGPYFVQFYAAGVPFYYDSQSISEAQGVSFQWRGMIPFHYPEEVVIEINEAGSPSIVYGAIATGWYTGRPRAVGA